MDDGNGSKQAEIMRRIAAHAENAGATPLDESARERIMANIRARAEAAGGTTKGGARFKAVKQKSQAESEQEIAGKYCLLKVKILPTRATLEGKTFVFDGEILDIAEFAGQSFEFHYSAHFQSVFFAFFAKAGDVYELDFKETKDGHMSIRAGTYPVPYELTGGRWQQPSDTVLWELRKSQAETKAENYWSKISR